MRDFNDPSNPRFPSVAGSAARALGLWSATALVIAHTIAVGIFLTPAEVIGAVASPALTLGLWVLCGGLVLAGAVTFGELAARYPFAGGPYVYLREAWGERIAFLYGWQSFLIMDPGVTAALATGVSPYVVVLWPAAAGAERWIAISVIWTMAAAGSIGLALSTRLLRLMTAFKLLSFGAVVVVAFTKGAGNWSNFQPFVDRHSTPGPLAETLAVGLVSVFFAFGGFWEASRVAGEVKEPKRTMPAALAIGVTCVTAVYVLTTLAFIYLVPIEQVTSAAEFAQRAGVAMLGDRGPGTLAFVVVVSVLASILALLIMAPRLYVAMSRDRIFPSAVAAVHARTGAPARATVLLAGIATLFVAIGTFEQIVAFFMCTTLTFIALAAAAPLVVRREAVPDAMFTFRARVAPALFILLVTGVVILVALNRPVQALAGAAIVLLGAPVYRAFSRTTGGGA